jgi:hypothetical protein
MSAIDSRPVSADSTDVWCVGFLPNFNGVIYKRRIQRHEPASVEAEPVPSDLARAFPNPFLDRTDILVDQGSALVFDLAGRRVRSLRGGGGRLVWDGRDDAGRQVPAGTYLVRPGRPDGREQTVRLVRLR